MSATPKPKKKKRPYVPTPEENIYRVPAVPGHVLPICLGAAFLLGALAMGVFQPPPGAGHAFEKGRFLLLMAGALACVWTGFSTRQLRVEVVGRELRVKGDLFFKTVDAGAIRIDRARIVNLSSDPDCGLSWWLFGVTLPGYKTGLRLLRRGGLAWVLLTDRREVLWLPTTKGYTFLLTLDRADHLLERLQAFASKLSEISQPEGGAPAVTDTK